MIKEKVFLFPLGNKVAVKRAVTAETTTGGIILPDEVVAKKKLSHGFVVAVGKGYKNNQTGDWYPMEVKVGDLVIFNQFQNMEFEIGDEKYLVMGEEDVYGIVKRGKAEFDENDKFVKFIDE